jgi:riboflavin synthase
MFTGLIAAVGSVVQVTSFGRTQRITIECTQLAPQLRAGDSIAVNGVCLTALDISADQFSADLAAETVARTSLTCLRPGTPVNLELPTRAGTPLGGHIVQGHVDGVARLRSLGRIPGGEDWKLTFELPSGLERYVVAKGSIAVEGISLTVAAISGPEVTIAIIPHTYAATNLKSLKLGDPLNIEVDVLAKYAEKQRQASSLTIEALIAQGF